MGFGVFIHRADSRYDDQPDIQYQFPKQYLDRALQCVGHWILYYEPMKVEKSRGYFAAARVAEIRPDPTAEGMHLAIIEPGSYLHFPDPVPFRDSDGQVLERGVLNDRGAISGRAQSAIRTLSAEDFDRIISRALAEDEIPPRLGTIRPPGMQEGAEPFDFEGHTSARQLVERAVRDRAFRTVVLRAYGERCAITGLRLINGGGRAEVEAAHIMLVSQGGPDIIGNGIALSGTFHWMFDRGLVCLDHDLTIRVSRQVNDQAGVRALINPEGRAHPPLHPRDRPQERFLAWHRANCFKH